MAFCGILVLSKNSFLTFLTLKGTFFIRLYFYSSVYHKGRSSLHNRKAIPLTDDEYDTHLFYFKPDPYKFRDTYGNTFTVPDIDQFKESQGLRLQTETTFDTISSSGSLNKMALQRAETVA